MQELLARGWTNRDIVHAMDHRPGLFGQATGVLICSHRIAAPKAFIASRLAAWHAPDGTILSGHWTARVTDAAATQAAQRQVAQRHGRAGAALLRPGERTLSAHRITEHGHANRPRQPPHPRRSQSHLRRPPTPHPRPALSPLSAPALSPLSLAI